jgi:hypothetical protein
VPRDRGFDICRRQTRPIKYTIAAALAVVLVFLPGCASTTVETTGSPLKEPLCAVGARALAIEIYWGTQWRPDQKEPLFREAAALRGIEDFLGRTSGLVVAGLHRLSNGDAFPSDEELMRSVASTPAVPERVVLIVVRELGPRITIGTPAIVEGGTEVLIDVRVLDLQRSVALANARTLWRNGGTFVVKGVKTLDQDMSAALTATLMPSAAER